MLQNCVMVPTTDGFSAGGHLAGYMGVQWQNEALWVPLALSRHKVHTEVHIFPRRPPRRSAVQRAVRGRGESPV